jgi:hypothetical protein
MLLKCREKRLISRGIQIANSLFENRRALARFPVRNLV